MRKSSRRKGYGESLAGTWTLIIIASAVVAGLGMNGAAAVIIAFALVIGLAAAGAQQGRRPPPSRPEASCAQRNRPLPRESGTHQRRSGPR